MEEQSNAQHSKGLARRGMAKFSKGSVRQCVAQQRHGKVLHGGATAKAWRGEVLLCKGEVLHGKGEARRCLAKAEYCKV